MRAVVQILFYLFFAIIIGAPIGFAYVYYTYDVQKLKDQYPVMAIEGKTTKWKLKKQRPENWIELSKISNPLKWAVVLSEDWAFYQHQGIDFNQLEKVFEESLENGKLTRGASTISQQLVKNVFLSSEKTILRKVKEWILTYKLERLVSKTKILESYFNIIHLGPNLYGIGPASLHYFGRNPSSIGPREGAFSGHAASEPREVLHFVSREKIDRFCEKES